MSGKHLKKRSKILMVASIFIAAAIIYMVSFYPWPATNSDLSGTIGGVEKVKKYQKEQITANDVSVQTDDIQKLLQNDKIQTLINDPDFRTAMANENFRTVFNRNPTFRNAIIGADYRTTMTNRNWVEALRNEGLRSITESGAFAKIISDGSLKAALSNEALRTADYRNYMNRNLVLRQLTTDASFMMAMRSISFRQLITSDAMRQLLDNRQFTDAFRTDAARTIFSDANFMMALRQEQFLRSASSDGFLRAISNDALARYLDNDAFRTALFRSEAGRTDAQRNIETQRNMEGQRNTESQRTNQY